MTSRQIEEKHVEKIIEILSHAGIECSRSPQLSSESEEFEEELNYEHVEVEEGEKTESEKSQVEVEEEQVEDDGTAKGPNVLFPSPSLRKVLPDNIRDIEKINRIHVLPEEFNTSINPAMIPKIALTAPKDYIDLLAELVGCVEYRNSLAEFWFLDTLANLLRRAQNDGFDRESQAVLILWWCEMMKEIQHFDTADRARLLRRFEDNMMEVASHVAVQNNLPTPAEVGVDYRTQHAAEVMAGPSSPSVSATPEPDNTKQRVTFDTVAYMCSVNNMAAILHYFYDLLSTDYQFELIRSIFTHSPDYKLVDTSHELHTPKSLYTIAKQKGKPKETKKKEKVEKKKIPDTAEYLRLMELKKKEEEELLAQELEDREDWEKKSHILPLSLAVEDDFFDKYWPPAPPPAPVIIEETKVDKKKPKKK